MPGGYEIGEGGSPSNVNQGQGYPGENSNGGGSPSTGMGYPNFGKRVSSMSDIKMPADAKDDLPKATGGYGALSEANELNQQAEDETGGHAGLDSMDVFRHTQSSKLFSAGDSMTPAAHQPMDHQEVSAHGQSANRMVTSGKSGQSSVSSLDHQTVHMGNLGKGSGRKTSRG